MDLTLDCKSMTTGVSGSSTHPIQVTIGGVDPQDIRSASSELIQHMDEDAVLEHIGVEKVKEYFVLVDG